MAVNQYVPKYIDCKIIQKKDDGDKGFLEKDHFNAVEDNYLFKNTKIGNSIIPSGTSLIEIINQVADEAIIGKNRIDSISVNHITQPIDANKNVDITVPTKLSDISSDSEHRTVSDSEKSTWNAKQNAVAWESDNYDPISNKAITKSDLNAAVAPLARTTHWRGVFNSLDEVTNPQNGDIAAVGYKEYVYCSDQEPIGWRELGDEDSYIHKGEVTNNDVKDNAAIAQSKIAGLVDALAEKVVKEVGKSLVLDTEIAKIHTHNNKETLDNITQTAWDTVVTNSNLVATKADTTYVNESLDKKSDKIPTKPTTCETVQGTDIYFDIFCNGIPVVIERGSTDNQIIVYYNDNKDNITVDKGSYKGIRLYGGCNDLGFPTYLPTTSIIINSGRLNSLFAGSVNSGKVGSATVMMNGGYVNGIVAGRSDGPIATKFHDNTVGEYRVIVNNAESNTYICGGGNGYSTTGHSYIEINGGTNLYVLAAGPNGNNGECEVVVNNGTVAELYTNNRGFSTKTKVTVNGGTVNKFYAGSDETPNVDTRNYCKYENSEIHLLGGIVTNLVAGYNYLSKDLSKVHGTYKDGIVINDPDKVKEDHLTKVFDKMNQVPCEITSKVYNNYLDVYCNGIPVVIERGSTDDEIIIYYDNKTKNYTASKGTYKGIRVFGGCGDLGFPTYLPSTSVTVNSGKFKTLYGASVNSGKVGSANVMINGGTIDGGVSAGRSDGGDPETSFHDNIVGNFTLIVNDCDYLLTAYGSSSGFSTVGNSYVEINGGSRIDYAITAASNGIHGNCEMVVNGGNIEYLGNIARGSNTKSKITVNGGNITSLVVGSEEITDKGEWYNFELHLNGGTVTSTKAGYNWLVSQTDPDISKLNGTYHDGVLINDSANIKSKLVKKTVIESIELNGSDLVIENKKAKGLIKSTLPIPNEISFTQMTSLQFCNKICELDTCEVGVIYSGYSKITDAPCNGCEVTVSVMKYEPQYGVHCKVLVLKMNSTNHHEKSWMTMYHNEEMKYGTTACPWESELLTPVSTSSDTNDYIGASRKYVNDSIKSAIQNIIYEDAQGGHIKISDNYTLNISPTGVITATYPTA